MKPLVIPSSPGFRAGMSCPILFLIYINDHSDGIQSKTRLFADDTIVYLTVANDSDAEALQDDLNKLAGGRTGGRWNSTLRNVTSLELPEAGNPTFITTLSTDISLKLKPLPST